jgi:hypothetical protein
MIGFGYRNQSKAQVDMKGIIGALLPLLLCVGCSVPLTPDALRQGHPEAASVCSSLTPDLAVTRLKQAWEHCYVGPGLSQVTVPVGGVPMTIPTAGGGGSMRVEVENKGDVRTLVLRTPSGKIFLLADISQTAECTAQVNARGWNGPWQRSAEHTAAWLDNPEAPGPLFGCK